MGVTSRRTWTKTRRRTRDLDQIKADLTVPKHLAEYERSKAPEDLPGLGKWYCIECARWFDVEANLLSHVRGKPHKRRVKQLQETAYTQKEADQAVGLGTDNRGPYRALEEHKTTGEAEMGAAP